MEEEGTRHQALKTAMRLGDNSKHKNKRADQNKERKQDRSRKPDENKVKKHFWRYACGGKGHFARDCPKAAAEREKVSNLKKDSTA
jgi:hypothetical protein